MTEIYVLYFNVEESVLPAVTKMAYNIFMIYRGKTTKEEWIFITVVFVILIAIYFGFSKLID